MLLGHGDIIILECGNISFDCLFDIQESFLSGLSLADAAGKTGDFCYPISVFSRSEDHLSHDQSKCQYQINICALGSESGFSPHLSSAVLGRHRRAPSRSQLPLPTCAQAGPPGMRIQPVQRSIALHAIRKKLNPLSAQEFIICLLSISLLLLSGPSMK